MMHGQKHIKQYSTFDFITKSGNFSFRLGITSFSRKALCQSGRQFFPHYGCMTYLVIALLQPRWTKPPLHSCC